MIEVRNVSKTYGKGEKPAIEHISFQVKPGQIHGLIGPNGSGKTTLIKCLTGIMKPDQGEVFLDGKPVYDNPIAKKRIGYVADNCNFFPNYKVSDMVKFFQGIYETFDAGDFARLNQVFEIPLTRKVYHMSKGQKMRLSFMLNMAMKPDVLVMDEPTSGLDSIAKADLMEQVITKVDYDETAVIISTHHLYELEKICDTVTMMSEGNAKFQGSLDAAKEQIRKYQVVFKDGLPKGILQERRILNYSSIGSVYTFLWDSKEHLLEENDDPAVTFFHEHGAGLAEKIEISLEELFIYSNKRRKDNE